MEKALYVKMFSVIIFLCSPLSLSVEPSVILYSLFSLAPFPVVGSEGLSSPLEPLGVTNGNTALPAARSTNSKQSEGGERERRGVIRKRNEEQE